MLENIAVIVRSTGERTESLCIDLAKQQVPQSHVAVIRERPFSRAVQKSYEIGLDFALEWTLCLDADILLRKNGISTLVAEIENLPANCFVLTAQLLDKLLGGIRPGMHLYRTTLLPLALSFIDDSSDMLRPETFVKQRMEEKGYPFVITKSEALGLHDFEQYYSDIYRKSLVHTHKHRQLMPYISSLWERLAPDDIDYQVALLGYRAGQIFSGKVKIDRAAFPEEIDGLLRLLGTQEKDPLNLTGWNSSKVDKIIADTSSSPEYIAWQREESVRTKRLGRVRLVAMKYGLLRSIPWILGKSAEKVGRKLQTWAEHTSHQSK